MCCSFVLSIIGILWKCHHPVCCLWKGSVSSIFNILFYVFPVIPVIILTVPASVITNIRIYTLFNVLEIVSLLLRYTILSYSKETLTKYYNNKCSFSLFYGRLFLPAVGIKDCSSLAFKSLGLRNKFKSFNLFMLLLKVLFCSVFSVPCQTTASSDSFEELYLLIFDKCLNGTGNTLETDVWWKLTHSKVNSGKLFFIFSSVCCTGAAQLWEKYDFF